MPLYIRDDAVADLAREVKEATGAKTVTEAVRGALERELRTLKDKRPFAERIAGAMALADAMGPGDPNFDFRKFREELWGDGE